MKPRALPLFLLRNVILFFFVFNAFLQLHEQLDLPYQSAAFLLGVVAALWMERSQLRFLPALLLACALPVVLRAAFFLVFRLQRTLAASPSTDFLFLLFDKDFPPALVGFALGWLFNFLALRRHGFVFVEVGLNSALLLAVFWTQAGFRLTIYPHPSILANLLAAFVVAELLVLLLAWLQEAREMGWQSGRPPARAFLSFAWIVLPLLLLSLFFVWGRYSESAVAAGGGLMKPTLFRFDFSPFVRLESEISMSDDEVMLFRTEGQADRWLLRRFVLAGYDPNRGFFLSNTTSDVDQYPTTVPDSAQDFADPGYGDRRDVPRNTTSSAWTRRPWLP